MATRRPVTPANRRSALVTAGALIALSGCSDGPLQATEGRLSAVGPLLATSAVAVSGDTITDAWIIEFSPLVRDVPGLARSLVSQHGGSLKFTYTSALKGFAVERLPAQALVGLQRNPNIKRVEPDIRVHVTGTQSPTPSWGLDRIDQSALPLNGTFSFANEGLGVGVYILDTGVRTSHVDFEGRAYGAFTAIQDGRGSNDCGGHGTHVAGTVGSKTYGVAKKVKLFSVRVMDCAGYGAHSGIAAGVDWITRNALRPAVANMSLGGTSSSIVTTAVQNSIKAGIVYAVSAGNDAADACKYFPASIPEVLTAGAAASFDAMSGFSNFGRCIDVFAPGQSIRSTDFASDTSSSLKAGTSMASPHVAGVAALYLSAHPAATPAQVSAAIAGAATSGVLSGIPSGTPNLLLNANVATSAGSLSPPDTTAPPGPIPAPNPVDVAPVANFSSSCPKGRCTFDAASSSDDYGISDYQWDFGDGSIGVSGPSVVKATHTFTKAGSYTITLTVTDAHGQRSTKRATVTLKKV